MSAIAIIPARSGSKGLSDKNIKLLNGRPMMDYSIKACMDSHCFDCIHVSTDSQAYADIAMECGADVPFLREGQFAEDTSTTEEVVKFVLREYEKRGQQFDIFAIIQPTSPLRNSQDINNAFTMMKEKNADSIIGVCEMEHSPKWTNTLPKDGSMNRFLTKSTMEDRHHFDIYYRINGAMYLVKTAVYTDGTAMYGPKSYAYVMPKERSIDIDDEYDFHIAEALQTIQKETWPKC